MATDPPSIRLGPPHVRMTGRSLTFRAFALLVAAGYGIHETRYLLVPKPRIDPAHGYLAYAP